LTLNVIQARALRHLQPPVREPICGLSGLGFLKSFFVVLTEKDLIPSAERRGRRFLSDGSVFLQGPTVSSVLMLVLVESNEFWFGPDV
jgi:hypothetical protein